LGVSAGLRPSPRRLLCAVRDVEDHRHVKGFHHRKAGEIIDQTVVAEKGPALGQHNTLIAVDRTFSKAVPIS